MRRFAEDVVAPKVREMDETEIMDPVVPFDLTARMETDQSIRLSSKVFLTME